MMVAGSPGSSCCSEKMSTDTKNSVGINCSRRLPRKVSMAVGYVVSPCISVRLQSDHAHDAVRHGLEAGQTGRVRDQIALMVQIDDAFFVQHLLGDSLVDRLALLGLVGQSRLVEPGIDVLVAKIADVLRRLALVEDIGIAVRVRPTPPPDLKSLEAAGFRLVERRRKLVHPEL